VGRRNYNAIGLQVPGVSKWDEDFFADNSRAGFCAKIPAFLGYKARISVL
jgi:hypothetical protein